MTDTLPTVKVKSDKGRLPYRIINEADFNKEVHVLYKEGNTDEAPALTDEQKAEADAKKAEEQARKKAEKEAAKAGKKKA